MSNFSKDNKQYNVFLYVIEFSNNIFVKYQTISCSNNKCVHQDVDPQPATLFMVLGAAGCRAGRQVYAGLGHPARSSQVHFFPLEGEFNETKSEEQILINC